jgi:hypothetical protein
MARTALVPLEADSYLDLKVQGSPPATPASGYLRVYGNADKTVHAIDDTGEDPSGPAGVVALADPGVGWAANTAKDMGDQIVVDVMVYSNVVYEVVDTVASPDNETGATEPEWFGSTLLPVVVDGGVTWQMIGLVGGPDLRAATMSLYGVVGDGTGLPLPKNNYLASSDPGAGNDNTEGYGVGSEWINLNTGAVFRLVDDSTGAAVWPELTGSGSAPAVLPLDAPALDSTYGDDFDGASLNGRWSRHNVTSAEETYQDGNGSCLGLDLVSVAEDCEYYQTPGTMPTNCEVIVKVLSSMQPDFGMFGPIIVDSSGNGVGATAFNDALWVWNISGWVQSGSGASGASAFFALALTGFPYWLKLRKAGTDYYASISWNGYRWSDETSAYSSAGARDHIGFGRFYRSSNIQVLVDRFNVLNIS